MKGASLIELIIVIVVIGIMSAIAIPMWPTSINLGAQADLLASDITYTQTLSISTGINYTLAKASSTTYQIQTASTGVPIKYPGTGNTTITLNPGITFGTFTNLPSNLVSFDGKGIPYTDSAHTLPLTVDATIPIVASSGETRTLTITASTGAVTIQ